MPDLWLIRHGETEWSLAGRHTGRTDLALTTHGESQAAALRQRLIHQKFAHVRVSPLRRARQTCQLSGQGQNAVVDPNLLEWDYGDYEGRTSQEIRSLIPGWTLWDLGVPGGETIDHVGRRADALLAEVSALEGPVALFAHGHVLRVLIARWLRLPPTDGRYWLLDPTSVSILGIEHGQPVLRIWNG